MNRLRTLFLFFVGISSNIHAMEHRHGVGKLLISQDESLWSVRLIIPAMDAVGFEHVPETPEQKNTTNKLKYRLEQNIDVIELADNCSMISVTQSLFERQGLSPEQYPKEPESHFDHEHHSKFGHNDIEVEYQFNCEGVVSRISVLLFKIIPSLSQVQAQWVRNGSQGMANISRGRPFIEMEQ